MTVVRAIEIRVERARRPSNLALKLAMSVTGVIFVGFVFVHMIGNLKIYGGPESLDSYARWLREVGYPLVPHQGVLWALRVVLVASAVLHVGASVWLRLRGRRARGSHRRHRMQAGLSAFGARTMLLGGVVILGFVVVHLLDLTIGVGAAAAAHRHPDADGTIHAYANVVASFSRPWMAAFYAGTMAIIALHVLHGWRTLLQDLGATGQRFRRFWVALGGLIALGVLLGNALIPILVQVGVIA